MHTMFCEVIIGACAENTYPYPYKVRHSRRCGLRKKLAAIFTVKSVLKSAIKSYYAANTTSNAYIFKAAQSKQ